MQQLNEGKKIVPPKRESRIPQKVSQSQSPARTSQIETEAPQVTPEVIPPEKKRNPFDRTCIVEGADESDEEVKQPPPPAVEPPPEKTLVMLNAADLARKKQQSKQKKEQDMKINQLAQVGKPNRIEKSLENMLQQQKDYEKRKEEEKKKEEEKQDENKKNLLTPTKLSQKRKTEAVSGNNGIKIEHGHVVGGSVEQKLGGKESLLELVGT